MVEIDKKDDVVRGLKRVTGRRNALDALESIWQQETIDQLPRDYLCSFRSEEERDRINEETLPLGEIFIAPVHVERRSRGGDDDGEGDDEEAGQVAVDNFWLVLLKTRRSFDLVGHIRDLLVTLEKRREKNNLQFVETERIINKLQTVLQYQFKMSPASRHKLQEDANARQYVFERFHLPEGHDTMDEACNIYECFRCMQHPYWRDDEACKWPLQLDLFSMETFTHS